MVKLFRRKKGIKEGATMNTYGITTQEGIHIDVSLSIRGAKRYATNHGYSQVSMRPDIGYSSRPLGSMKPVRVVAVKLLGKWEDVR